MADDKRSEQDESHKAFYRSADTDWYPSPRRVTKRSLDEEERRAC